MKITVWAVWAVAVPLQVALTDFCEASPVQWATADGGSGHWYDAVPVEGGIDWYSINPDPEGQGWHLATITSAEENLYIYGLIKDDPRYWLWDGVNAAGPWIGGYQPPGSPEPAGGWSWVTGELWVYENWASAEPNNLGGEECAHFFAKGKPADATLNDLKGLLPLPGYVREMVPEPASLVLLLVGAAAVKRFGRQPR